MRSGYYCGDFRIRVSLRCVWAGLRNHHWQGRGYHATQKGSACHSHFLKAPPTKYGPALAGCERNRSLRPAFRARCPRLRANRANRLSKTTVALRLTWLAVFRIVRKLFVLEEKLLARGKHKLGSAIHARQLSVNEAHDRFRQSCRMLAAAPESEAFLTRKPLFEALCRSE